MNKLVPFQVFVLLGFCFLFILLGSYGYHGNVRRRKSRYMYIDVCKDGVCGLLVDVYLYVIVEV